MTVLSTEFRYLRQIILSQLYFCASMRRDGSMIPPRRRSTRCSVDSNKDKLYFLTTEINNHVKYTIMTCNKKTWNMCFNVDYKHNTADSPCICLPITSTVSTTTVCLGCAVVHAGNITMKTNCLNSPHCICFSNFSTKNL